MFQYVPDSLLAIGCGRSGLRPYWLQVNPIGSPLCPPPHTWLAGCQYWCTQLVGVHLSLSFIGGVVAGNPRNDLN